MPALKALTQKILSKGKITSLHSALTFLRLIQALYYYKNRDLQVLYLLSTSIYYKALGSLGGLPV